VKRAATAIASGLLTALALAAGARSLTAGRVTDPVPSFADVRARYRPSDAQLLDRHGEVLQELRVDRSRRRLGWHPLAEISPALQAAVIASEDRRFYRHDGVDTRALLAAALRRVTGGSSRGASTITMQLAALLDPTLQRRGGPRSVRQKWRQMRRARAIEQHWSKSQILEAYLNLVTFRGELQGAAAAAAVLFGKAPHGLDEGESDVLAALLRSPNAAPDAVAQRARHLAEVVRSTWPKEALEPDLQQAVTRALSAPGGSGPRVALAPHAAHLLLRPSATLAPVRSTLDIRLQRFVNQVLRRRLLAVRDRHVEDGAVLVVDNASGDVLAYVGSSGGLSKARFVDGVRARRQTGSALKPFLYALAFDERLLTPASLLEDTPLEIPVFGGLYRPQNYDEQFRGLVSVRTALAGSINIPAVRTLGLVGTEVFVARLRQLGLAGLTQSGDYYGPSLALGSADVSLWQLTNAYRALANGGLWSPLRLTPDEAVDSPPRRVYSPEAAFLVSDILADRDSRSVTFGLDNPLVTRFWTAVKTGTSKEMRDNWCLGYSRRYTVGVWVGNFSGAPMQDVSGITGAAPVWLDVINWLHRRVPSDPPAPPAGVRSREVSFPAASEPSRVEWFRDGTEPAAARAALARERARILAPVSDTIIALDPDIPPARQRVTFEARQARQARWVLDGLDLGAADRPLLWPPRPGKHTLELRRAGRNAAAPVRFVVRGPAIR